MKYFKDSLGLWLVCITLAATTPILFVIVESGQEHRRTEIEHAERAALHLTQALAHEQEALTRGIWQLLSALAQFPEVKNLDAPALNPIFADLLAKNPALSNVTLTDPQGNLLASGRPFTRPVTFAGQRQIEITRRSLRFSAGEYQTGAISGVPILPFAYPVQDDAGRLKGMLTCSLDMQRYQELFDQAGFPTGSIFVIADHSGKRLLVHPKSSVIGPGTSIAPELWAFYTAQGAEGLDRHPGTDGTMRYYAFHKVTLPGDDAPYMTIIVGTSEAVALARADRFTKRSVLWTAGAAALSLLLAFGLSQRGILSRMDRLAKAAERIGAGNLSARVGPGLGAGVFAQVGRAFDDMAQALEKRQQELTRAEAKAKAARNVLQDLIDSLPSAIVCVDEQCRVTLINQTASESTGLSRAQARGQDMGRVCANLSVIAPQVRQALAEGRSTHLTRLPDRIRPGSRRLLDILVCPLSGGDKPGAVIRIDDVTQRERVAEMLAQTEKMMSVGGLAAGMAHEINNPLGGIMQSAQVLMRRLFEDTPTLQTALRESGCDAAALGRFLTLRDARMLLQGIRDSGARAAAIVANMLEFSRGNEARRSSVDLAELLDKTLELAASDYDLKKMYDFRKIRIERDYAEDLPPVVCSRTEIEQVFLNLLKNAAQALWSARDEGREPVITLRTTRENGYARIEVEDNGPGMEESVRRRIFEPFYTTKEPGQGTGLGLSVAFFLVNGHHSGTLEVASTPGQGACFVVRLPFDSGAA